MNLQSQLEVSSDVGSTGWHVHKKANRTVSTTSDFYNRIEFSCVCMLHVSTRVEQWESLQDILET